MKKCVCFLLYTLFFLTEPASSHNLLDNDSGSDISFMNSNSGPDYWLHINGLSRHFTSKENRSQLRETNTGLGIDADMRNGFFLSGDAYIDSFGGHALSAGGGKRWELLSASNIGLSGGLAGVITRRRRYSDSTSLRYEPQIFPVATISTSHIGINAIFEPKIPNINSFSTAFVQIAVKLN